MSDVTPELEKVATALFDALLHPGLPINWNDLSDEAKGHALRMARAALEAIREPSEGMLHAMGVDHAKERYVPIQEQNIIDGYVAAIDHILGKEPTP